MWNDLVFDGEGNLFMTDDKPRLWKVTPDGKASIWFQDDRLLGLFGFAGGPLGGRIDPSGEFLYFTITISAAFPYEAVVYRLPLVDHPSASDLQVVHHFPAPAGQIPPQAAGLAFAESGNIYVGLIGTNQIALEKLGVQVDQLVSYFAWAEDYGPDGQSRRTFSDIFFAEVRPFEEIFRADQSGQSASQQQRQQQSGQQGNQPTRLAELQKQIVIATWKLQGNKTVAPKESKP